MHCLVLGKDERKRREKQMFLLKHDLTFLFYFIWESQTRPKCLRIWKSDCALDFWIASWRILVCSVSYGKMLSLSYYDDDKSFCLILRFWKWDFMDHLFLFLALGVWFSGCFFVYILYILSIVFFASQLIFYPCKLKFFSSLSEIVY